MQAGSFIGFGVVFALVAWGLSLMLTAVLRASRRPLRRLGPAAERRAVELVAVVPIVVALAVVALLVIRSQVGRHHCELHQHHLHLCVLHGAPWAGEAWAVLLVGGAAVFVTLRLAVHAAEVLRQRRAVSRLRRTCRHDGRIYWVDTPHALCFVAGIRRPQIFVSTGVWSTLEDDERAAMLAHEQAHVRQHDVARTLVLDLLLISAAPLGRWLRRTWSSATERLCDARAAAAVGDAAAVASAMVKVCRLGATTAPSPAGFTPPTSAMTERVEAVLAELPSGDGSARALFALAVSVAAAGLFFAAVQAAWLHHHLEDLLG